MKDQPILYENQTLSLSEALTIYQVEAVHEVGVRAMHSCNDLIVDFTKTREIDGCGVQLVLALYSSLKAKGGGLSLRGVNSDIQTALALFNLPENLNVEDSK